jgi:hypothetical protein
MQLFESFNEPKLKSLYYSGKMLLELIEMHRIDAVNEHPCVAAKPTRA